MKRIIAMMIAAVMTSAIMVQPAFAEESFPHEFWALADRFIAAQDSGDDEGIIEAGISICNLLENSPKNSGTISVLGTRYQDIANAYERKGDFGAAAEYFRKYLPYGRELGWDDGVRIAEAKVSYYEPILEMYLETDACPVYYGAKHEPVSGVLFGQTDEQMQSAESMRLVYVEFGEPFSDLNRGMMERAAEAGKAVELALNFPYEGATAASVPGQTEYIESLLRSISPYTEKIPVFLRIGAEMDVWANPAEPEVYITAYRTIAQAARSIAPNIALVWSVNHVSGWDTDVTEYYPGDEYVDWVGISAYMGRYFQNKVVDNDDRVDEIMFSAGRGADPVYVVKNVVEKFGGRKPIMISEGGASHYNRVLGADSTAWAVEHLYEFYGWLPMVYPQIKLIAYFNNDTVAEANDYSLKNSPSLTEAYEAATSDSVYIKNNASGTGTSYIKLDGQTVQGSFTIASYAHFYEQENIKVEYYIDDVFAAAAERAPYKVTLSAPGAGVHTVTAVAYAADGSKIGQNTVNVAAEDKITILYNGGELSGDVPPCISDGRTLVPLRLIFNAMGAQVDWDDSTKTVSSKLGEKTVSMQVGNPVMLRNGEEVTLDVPPVIADGRTLVPVRAVAEAYGAFVDWDAANRTVVINY